MQFSETPNPDNLRELAWMQATLLPTSLISALGADYCESVFAYAAGENSERVYTATDDGRLVAGALVTLQPADFARRLFSRTPVISSLARQTLRGNFQVLRKFLGRSEYVSPAPELISLFANSRSKGSGTALLKHVEQSLAREGWPAIRTRTEVHESDGSMVTYYERYGYVVRDQFHAGGRAYAALEKILTSTIVTEDHE